MIQINTNSIASQSDCPLYTSLPPEIRDRIFDLAVGHSTDKQNPYPAYTHYNRPGFRYADRKLSTTLLLTCRLVYLDTHFLPARNYVRIDWFHRGPDGSNRAQFRLPPALENLHIFTQQFWLESWGTYARHLPRSAPNLKFLKITIRHSDWWWWERSAPLLWDPKQKGTASAIRYTDSSDPFDERSWGYQFRHFRSLKVFELELETVEGKMRELDDIVARAPGWRFTLEKGNELVLSPSKTKREGWQGTKIHGQHVPNNPIEAKKRLVEAGVDFMTLDDAPEIPKEDCLTYYVVTLVFQATELPM